MPQKAKKRRTAKGAKDIFASFFEDPSRESFRQILTDHLGEDRSVDFKREWLEPNNIAKKALGFANTGPGCLIFGVEENADGTLTPTGLKKLEDKADIQNKLRKYLPTQLMDQVDVLDFSYQTSEYEKIQGMKFQVMIVEYHPEYIPFMPKKSSSDLKDTAIYFRRDGLTVEASYEELQGIISDRVDTKHSANDKMRIKKYIEHLKILYAAIPPSLPFMNTTMSSLMTPRDSSGETFDEFVTRMIVAQKRKIEKALE